MGKVDIIAIKQRETDNKKKWLAVNPYLTDNSGIYVLQREENGFRYAYIGLSKHILTRLAEHLDGYEQHIDKSLKKHGLFSIENPTGWLVLEIDFDESELNAKEQKYIREYANRGYQLLNKTSGSQGAGKFGIADNKPAKGYYDGKKQGKSDIIKELNKVVKYLQISPKDDGKLAARMYQKFWEILGE